LSAFRDDPIANPQTAADNPHCADTLAGLNGTNADPVIGSHYGDLI
jgi:hypothetical protein